MRVTAYSQIGAGKKECQDKILVGDTILSEGYYENTIDLLPAVVAVADGVGGNSGGELAAFMAVDGVRGFKYYDLLEKGDIAGMIEKINRDIIAYGDENLEYENMATTLTGIYFSVSGQILFHVGNTRTYLFSGEYLICCTKDHTAVQEAKDAHRPIEDIPSNIITACMGDGDELSMKDYLGVENTETHLANGNMLMLTSDGIHDYVTDDEIKAIYEQVRNQEANKHNNLKDLLELAVTIGYTPETQVQIEETCGYDWKKEFIYTLTKTARENGSVDDISIVLILD